MADQEEKVKLYGDRDVRALGKHYTKHLLAMTEEGLHDKSDIAAELAFRDSVVSELMEMLIKEVEAGGALPETAEWYLKLME